MIAEIGDFASQSGTVPVRSNLPISVHTPTIDLVTGMFMPGFPAVMAGAAPVAAGAR
jgi:hypothetical protein